MAMRLFVSGTLAGSAYLLSRERDDRKVAVGTLLASVGVLLGPLVAPSLRQLG